MKAKGLRLISLIIILPIIFATFGCARMPNVTTPSDSEKMHVDWAGGIYIYEIDYYNRFLQTNAHIPDNFITADMLKILGSFQAFVNESEKDFNAYWYCLVHEDSYRLGFSLVTQSFSELQVQIIDNSLAGSTMETITDDITGRIIGNGLEYCYINGNLLYIQWVVNGKVFMISLDLSPIEGISSTLSEDSILRKLLSKNAEDQIAAYNQLVDMVTK